MKVWGFGCSGLRMSVFRVSDMFVSAASIEWFRERTGVDMKHVATRGFP